MTSGIVSSGSGMFAGLRAVAWREFRGYFQTPVAYVFCAVFLLASGAFTFHLSHWFEKGQASLEGFFFWHPWLFLFLVPAIAMRLWAEERRQGTVELLLTLPIPLWQIVWGKFLAAWGFVGVALGLTFPMVVAVMVLGNPDPGLILTGYVGSFLTAGVYLAVGSCASAGTSNQIIAFVLGALGCFVLTLMGFPLVMDALSGWVPLPLLDVLGTLGVLTHLEGYWRGVVEWRSIVYFLSLIGGCLSICFAMLEPRA